MRVLLALALLGAASAFTQRSTMSMKFGVTPPAGAKLYTDELGAQRPLGYFDPIGLVTNVDQERFDRLRGVELKHGRVAMLAFLGHLTTSAGFYLPGYISKSNELLFSDVKPGLAAFESLPPLATFQIILFVGFLEINVMRDVTGLAEFPGDFRNGALDYGWDTFSPQEQ